MRNSLTLLLRSVFVSSTPPLMNKHTKGFHLQNCHSKQGSLSHFYFTVGCSPHHSAHTSSVQPRSSPLTEDATQKDRKGTHRRVFSLLNRHCWLPQTLANALLAWFHADLLTPGKGINCFSSDKQNFCVSILTCRWHNNNWKITADVLSCVDDSSEATRTFGNTDCTYRSIIINGAIGLRIWGKAQENCSWMVFVPGASVLLHPPILSVSSQTPSIFAFDKSITSIITFFYNTFLQSPQASPAHLCPSSLLRLQEEPERSYNLDTLQRYCFQLYKFHLYQHCDPLLSTCSRQSELQLWSDLSKVGY